MEEEEAKEMLEKLEDTVSTLEDEEEVLKFDSERHEEFERKMQEVHEQIEFLQEVLQNK